MEKLLAALNLPQVGEIRLVDQDDESYEEENDGSLFTIELNDRVYTMKVGFHFSKVWTCYDPLCFMPLQAICSIISRCYALNIAIVVGRSQHVKKFQASVE